MEAPTCPRCHATVTPGEARCLGCGASLLGAGALPDHHTAIPPAADRRGWIAWGVGAGLGLLATLLPLTGWIAWFVASLCHEIGHCAAALVTGSIAVPAIRLDGHAMASMTDPLPLVRFAIWAGIIAAAVRAWRRQGAWTWWLAAAILYPLVAWPGREVFRLYAGQFGELAFAGVFLWRAWTGGFTEQPAERPLYALLGWALVVGNLGLSWGLMTDSQVRAAYWESGSFGLTNDLIRIAHDHLGIALSTAAVPLLLASLATPVLAWWVGQRWLRRRA